MTTVSIRQQIEEVEREIALRANVYPRMVSSGKMRESVAEFHTERIKAVLATLQWLQQNEPAIKARTETPAAGPAAPPKEST